MLAHTHQRQQEQHHHVHNHLPSAIQFVAPAASPVTAVVCALRYVFYLLRKFWMYEVCTYF